MTGLTEDAFRFVSARPVSAQHGQMWVRAAQLVSSQLSGVAGNSMTAVLHRTLITVAAATALEVFPSTAMTRGYLARPGDVRPATVRRAVAYVDAHASLPITISDAASAAGTSAHALHAAFRRHLGTSFTAYLRRVRAAAARDDLEKAGEGEEAPLETIALQWGFLSAQDLRAALDDDQQGRRS